MTNVLETPFADQGISVTPDVIDRAACARFSKLLSAAHPLDGALFMDEAEFLNNPDWRRHAVNPNQSSNFVDTVDFRFVEESESFDNLLTRFAGKNYKLLSRRAQRLFPKHLIPGWILERVRNDGLANLNYYVKEEYRAITHILYYDFHQDIVTYDKNHEMLSVCVYMDDVSDTSQSPLIFLPGSHKFGVTHYPHRICRDVIENDVWVYMDDQGRNMRIRQQAVFGGTATAVCFHSLTLHGSRECTSAQPRIVLRFLAAPADDHDGNSELARSQLGVIGPSWIANRRLDTAADGSQIPLGNVLNSHPW